MGKETNRPLGKLSSLWESEVLKEFAGTGLDFEEVKFAFEKVNTGGIRVSVPSPDRGRREGKAPMTENKNQASRKRQKNKFFKKKAGLAEANQFRCFRKSFGKEEDTIRAKLEANAELKESVLWKGQWKLTQLKKLNFEEVKAEFEKLVKQLDTYVPMNFEATKESLKRFGEELQNKTAKKLKFDDEGKDSIQTMNKDESEDSDEANENDDSTQLYRIIMKTHGMNELEDEFEKVNKDICWRYYDACRVHCLNLESADVFMLIERKYHLSAEVCKAMLDKKLQGGKPDEDCYKLLKMIEKQARIRK
ncbi:hypothetical protein Tco_1419104 [Tanacetum coccineum]